MLLDSTGRWKAFLLGLTSIGAFVRAQGLVRGGAGPEIGQSRWSSARAISLITAPSAVSRNCGNDLLVEEDCSRACLRQNPLRNPPSPQSPRKPTEDDAHPTLATLPYRNPESRLDYCESATVLGSDFFRNVPFMSLPVRHNRSGRDCASASAGPAVTGKAERPPRICP